MCSEVPYSYCYSYTVVPVCIYYRIVGIFRSAKVLFFHSVTSRNENLTHVFFNGRGLSVIRENGIKTDEIQSITKKETLARRNIPTIRYTADINYVLCMQYNTVHYTHTYICSYTAHALCVYTYNTHVLCTMYVYSTILYIICVHSCTPYSVFTFPSPVPIPKSCSHSSV